MRQLLVVCVCLILAGCASNGLNIKTDVQTVKVPLLYCPAPPDFLRPELPIHNLTNAELRNDGKVAQAYAASVLQLLGYVSELEKSLNFYNDANASYEELERRLRETALPNTNN